MLFVRVFSLIATLMLASCDPSAEPVIPDRSPPEGSVMHGVYEGKIPCEDCERVKVRLTLHRSADDGSPTSYLLERILVGKGDDRHVTQGEWSEDVGAPVDPDGAVYLLDSQTPDDFRRYLAVGDDLLLQLDAELEPRVGNSVHSFTLSRTE